MDFRERVVAELAEEFGPGDWRRDGLCLEHPSVSWWPAPGECTDAAKRVCGRCLVKLECLDYAIRHKIKDGLWGGLSPDERRQWASRAG